MGSSKTAIAALLLQFCCYMNFGAATDTITSAQSIKDPEAILSPSNIFKLGFFSPVNSTNRYVGIWYNRISILTPVCVANRERPLTDSSGIMKISKDGNLVILNGDQQILWSTNVSSVTVSSRAHLTDDGNLILQGDTNGESLWESFWEPSDTIVQAMRLNVNDNSGKQTKLISWQSPSDPKFGSFSAGFNSDRIAQFFIWNEGKPYWRSVPWNGQAIIGGPNMSSLGFNVQGNEDGTYSVGLNYVNGSLLVNIVLSSEGKLKQQYWDEGKQAWDYEWRIPETECDVYGKCGEFSVCNAKNSPICSCLPGFTPKNADEWATENWTSGCVRRRLLQADRVLNGDPVGKGDGFLKLKMMKLPDFSWWSSSSSNQTQCEQDCLKNYSCLAYSYYAGFGCILWMQNLIDLQRFSSGGADLYIRLALSEFENRRNMKIIVSVTVILGTVIAAIGAFFLWKWMARLRGEKIVKSTKSGGDELKLLHINMSPDKLQELPFFNLQTLATATGNFALSKKLGEGGFGPVYKGKLPDGQEIAVKRLSKASGQGLEEFMNEVAVISKLQHRNLVRLFGCCAEGEEKMLVYEFMPNKSLDAFVFVPSKKELLDWRKRFHIVEGICRGLLYLHRDSRLKIIHRDLKASNILLDQDLNPKISDFGMARIFGGNEDQGNTRRVVGTYGYMLPEYAMEGRFSEKSDVFSFGVLLLEIVSGRRNISFYEDDQALSLLEFAWKLWNEGKIKALVDPTIYDPSFEEEFLRCIHVSLLCVQETARDRPAMSAVISMLNSEIVDLPHPKHPAFTARPSASNGDSSDRWKQKKDSVNNVTVTVVEGR